MTHTQALSKLAADTLVQTLEEDVARVMARTFALGRHDAAIAANYGGHALPPLLRRWSCVLQADDAKATALYRHKTALALAIVLHRNGLADAGLNTAARTAIDSLNAEVALSDDFFRKSAQIRQDFLDTPPAPPKRSPGLPDSLTFYRAADVVAMELDGRFYALYVHGCARTNQSPIVEFYDAVFDHLPQMAELADVRARGRRYNDGVGRVARFSISGLKFLPDPAGQFTLVKACVETPPDPGHLQKGDWLYTVSDIFELQSEVDSMFGPGGKP
ncbi:hypothetical protein [Delftia sp. 60]|uniref:hypothetical protein n=1 Tax=Delftia sp. 60 TaxID=2035216 RepID=UPI00211EA0B9|nr:hypothetical protein [Delftia sp. 60]